MDKRDLLDRLAANGDERLLLGRVWDKYEQCRRRNIPVVTGFLSPAEQELVRRLMGALDVREGWLLWGGYDTAQRRQAHFLPDWQTEPDFEAVAALRATFYEPNSLTHRDVLGSLMGLEIRREALGDIVLPPDAPGTAYVFALEPAARLICQELLQAGRTELATRLLAPDEVPEFRTAERRKCTATVSSLRLDAVLAAMLHCSRGQASELVTAGRVEINHLPAEKPSAPVYEGDVFTVRGKGRFALTALPGKSKKERLIIEFFQY